MVINPPPSSDSGSDPRGSAAISREGFVNQMARTDRSANRGATGWWLCPQGVEGRPHAVVCVSRWQTRQSPLWFHGEVRTHHLSQEIVNLKYTEKSPPPLLRELRQNMSGSASRHYRHYSQRTPSIWVMEVFWWKVTGVHRNASLMEPDKTNLMIKDCYSPPSSYILNITVISHLTKTFVL